MLAGQRLAKGDGGEVPVGGRQPDGGHALDELLRLPAVLDQVLDGDHLDPVLLAVGNQVGNARHRPVLAHDLADHSRRIETGEPGEVDGGLGLARTLEHSAAPGAKREDVARLDEVVRPPARVDRNLDRPGAVGRRDAGRDPLARLDRDRERGPERRLVRSVICRRSSSSQRSSVRQRQTSPRPCVAMKLIASGVANCAAIVRSPSFSRSAASTTTTNLPSRMSSRAASMLANGVVSTFTDKS